MSKNNENHEIEYKSVQNETLEKEVVSFLNSRDGIIYIGVDPKGNPVTTQNIDKTMLQITNRLATNILPSATEFVKVLEDTKDGVPIITIHVSKGIKHLYYIKKYGHSSSGVYVRSGSQCQSLNDEEIKRRFLLDIDYKPKELVEIESKYQNYTFKDMKFLYHQADYQINDEMFNENHHLLMSSGKFNMLAEILADKNGISLLLVRFEDKIKTERANRIEYGKKSLLVGIKELMQYVSDIINVPNVDITGIRTEKLYFDNKAFEEGFMNAVQYHDWSNNKSYPRVFAYTDRIEIESYGGLPSGLTEEQFYKGKHKSVSKELTEILSELRYIEHQGYGVPYIVKKYGREAFDIMENCITLTIPYNFIDSRIATNVIDNTLESKIIDLIKGNNKLTRSEMAISLGVSVRTIGREISKSVLIKRVGSDKNGHWEIIITE